MKSIEDLVYDLDLDINRLNVKIDHLEESNKVLKEELAVIKEQTKTNTVRNNTIMFMLDKICKALKIELRK